jgi:hypothetical protein
MNKERKQVLVKKVKIPNPDSYLTLQEYLNELKSLVVEHGGDKMIHRGYIDPYDDYMYSYIRLARPETDEEMDNRIEEETRLLEQEKKRELSELKRLKEKYNK